MFLVFPQGRCARLASPSASLLPRCFLLVQQARRRRFTAHRAAAAGVPLITGKPLRILFCGSDDFSCVSLDALVAMRGRTELIEHIRVVCRPPKPAGSGMKKLRFLPVHLRAQEHDLRYSHVDCEDDWKKDPAITEENFNLIVAVSFGLMVPGWLIKSAEYGGLNIHPSLLPDLRGPAPVHWAILLRRPRTGVTLQTLSIGSFDRGKILARSPLPGIEIYPDATVERLTQTLAFRGAEMLTAGLAKGLHLQARNPGFAPQFPRPLASPNAGPAHAPKITPADRQLRWTEWTADEVALRNRVLGPLWSYAFVPDRGRRRVLLDKISAPGIMSWPPEVVPFLRSAVKPPEVTAASPPAATAATAATDGDEGAISADERFGDSPTGSDKDDGPKAWPEEVLRAEGKRRGVAMSTQIRRRGVDISKKKKQPKHSRLAKTSTELDSQDSEALVASDEFDWYSLKTATFFELQDEEHATMEAFDQKRLPEEARHRKQQEINHRLKSAGKKPKVEAGGKVEMQEMMHLVQGTGRPVELPFFLRHYGTPTDAAVIPLPTIPQRTRDANSDNSDKDAAASAGSGGVIAIRDVKFDSDHAFQNATVAFHSMGGAVPSTLDKCKNEANMNDELPTQSFVERFVSKFPAMHELYRGWRVESSSLGGGGQGSKTGGDGEEHANAEARVVAGQDGRDEDTLSLPDLSVLTPTTVTPTVTPTPAPTPTPTPTPAIAIPIPKADEKNDFEIHNAEWEAYVQRSAQRFDEVKEDVQTKRREKSRLRRLRENGLPGTEFRSVRLMRTDRFPLQSHLQGRARPAAAFARQRIPRAFNACSPPPP